MSRFSRPGPCSRCGERHLASCGPHRSDAFRCRNCKTPVDGLGTPCGGCGNAQRIVVRLADGQIRYLPIGMTLAEFDAWLDPVVCDG